MTKQDLYISESSSLSFEDFLLKEGHLSPQQLHLVSYEKRKQGLDSPTLLVEMGLLTSGALGELFTLWKGNQGSCLSLQKPDPDLYLSFTRQDAENLQALPMEYHNNRLVVAMIHPQDCMTKDKLLHQFPNAQAFESFPILPADFYTLLDQVYGQKMDIEASLQDPQALEVQSFLDGLFKKALKAGTSDIHFEPGERLVRVRFRLDGVLQPTVVFHRDLWIAVSIRLKMMSHLNIAENRLPQFGRYTLNIEGRRLDCRLSTHPTQYGESIVIRLLDQHKDLHHLHHLGFSTELNQGLQRLMHHPQGLIIVTGPTGSGKTTTLYALLAALNAQEKKLSP